MPSGGFGIFPGIVLFFVVSMFILVGGTIIIKIIGGVRQNIKNNSSPVENTFVKLIAKRADVHGADHAWTTYYVTFELPDGQRREFQIKDKEYGLLAEGDQGMLSFQGTRFLSFERQNNSATVLY